MGEINIPQDEQEALKAIDAKELDKLVERAVQEERLDDLYHLPLTSCGPYVAAQLHAFEQALARIIHQRFGAAARRRADGWRQRRGMTGLEGCGDRFARGHVAPAVTAAAWRRGRSASQGFPGRGSWSAATP